MRIAGLVIAVAMCSGADLETLRREHRWFELREALKTQPGSALDRGAAASAFQDLAAAEHELRGVKGDDAHEILATMYLRNGLYARAAKEARAKKMAGDRAMIDALGSLRDQLIESRKPATLRGEIREHALFVPISINGIAVKGILDTDSNMSILSESEAKRLGLKKLTRVSTSGVSSDSSGRGQLTVADRFEIGGVRLRNVAFTTVGDEQQPFKDLPPGERVVIGVPVMIAMERLQWQRDGTLRIGGGVNSGAAANLCFDQTDPIVRAEYQGRKLEMLFDTGSDETYLWKRFAREFPGVIEDGKKSSKTMTGYTGSVDVDAVELPSLAFRIGGEAKVSPIRVLMNKTLRSSEWLHGWLGFDAMEHGGVIDFRAMTFSLLP